jgi:proteasome lid subunit RPN8/RPN11
MSDFGESWEMAIKVRTDQVEAIRHHGESTFPFECCGLLLGRFVDGDKILEETYPVANAREEGAKHNRFLIPPEVVLKAEKYARGKKLDVLGFYHSHPNAEARPSQFDLDHAWPFYSYVIVSVKGNKAQDINSWRMAEDRSQFDLEPIVTVDRSVT